MKRGRNIRPDSRALKPLPCWKMMLHVGKTEGVGCQRSEVDHSESCETGNTNGNATKER